MKTVYAHETESDNGISALLHVDPNDVPVINKEAKFFFTFKDSSGKFDITRCDCNIVLLKDDQQLDSKPISPADDGSFTSVGSHPLYTHTFADAGVYEVEFTGEPKNGADFQSFALHYDVRVEATGSGASGIHSLAHQHLGHIVIFGGGLVAAIVLLVRNYYQMRKAARAEAQQKITKEN